MPDPIYTPVGVNSVDTGANPSVAAPGPKQSFYYTDGWYVAIACVSGVVLADTRIGPIAFGILSLALIYQLTLLVQGK